MEELKAAFGYLACAFGHLNPFGAGHWNIWGSVKTRDRLGCRPHFAVDKVTAETDVAGTVLVRWDLLLCCCVYWWAWYL